MADDHQEALGARDRGVGLELLGRDEAVDRVRASASAADTGRWSGNRRRPSACRPSPAGPRAVSSPRPTMMPDLVKIARIVLLDLLEQAQRVEVARAGPDRRIEPRHRLEVVVVDVGPRRDDRLDARRPCAGSRASGSRSSWPGDAARIASMHRTKWTAPPSGRSSRSTEVMTMCCEAQLATASATCAGSSRIDRPRHAGLDVAEGAGARADVAQDHHRGVLLGPALADVRAGRLLAHRVQAWLAHQPAGLVIAGRARRLDPDPGGLAADASALGAIDDGGHRTCFTLAA